MNVRKRLPIWHEKAKVASSLDEPAERHVKFANIVLEKAKRMVEWDTML